MLSSSFLVYTTMILGVYLSSVHQSLSCPEWPLCPNGFLMPPEPSYIVEYFHRVFVVITAGTIYATLVFACVKIREMQHLTVVAALIVSLQILIGALVVTSGLDTMLVSIHLPIGVALFGITLLTFLQYNRITSTNETTSKL